MIAATVTEGFQMIDMVSFKESAFYLEGAAVCPSGCAVFT
jgi:hypothetical protein